MTTTCYISLRNLKNSLQPKIVPGKYRHFNSHADNVAAKRKQSSFLEEFLDTKEVTPQSSMQLYQYDRLIRSSSDCDSPSKISFHHNTACQYPLCQIWGCPKSEKLVGKEGVVSHKCSISSVQLKHAFCNELRMSDPVLQVIKPCISTSDDMLFGLESASENDIMRREDRHVMMLPDMIRSPKTFDPKFDFPTLTDWERNLIQPFNAQSILASTSVEPDPSKEDSGKPSEQQLLNVSNALVACLPTFFSCPHDYSIYHKNVIFNNNLLGITTRGLTSYMQQLIFVRIIGNVRFASVKFEILKITTHIEDGTVRLRWRIRGVSGLKLLLKWLQGKYKNKLKDDEVSDWYDGFSVFYVGSDGLIHTHVCDKITPDEDKGEIKNLATKLALLLGFLPRPSLDRDLNALIMAATLLREIDPNHPVK